MTHKHAPQQSMFSHRLALQNKERKNKKMFVIFTLAVTTFLFVYHTMWHTPKVTAAGTKLPWLAFRRTDSNRTRPWRTQTLPLST